MQVQDLDNLNRYLTDVWTAYPGVPTRLSSLRVMEAPE